MTSKTVDCIKEFYRKCETTIRKTKVWYRAAIAGLQSNIAGLLCYLLGWISGIILLLVKKRDAFVRFHAAQSIVAFGILTVPILALNLLTLTNVILYWFLVIVYWIVITFSLFLWIFLMFEAYRGQTYRLQVIGGIASKLSQIGGRDVFTDEEVRSAFELARDKAAVVKMPKSKRRIKHDIETLRDVLTETVKSIVILCETRDPYTAGHQERVAQLACAIAREMGLSEDQIEGIRVMGVVHDIGKVAVPAEILSKPGKLSDHEFGIIKTHPQAAFDILKGLEFPLMSLGPIARAILQHHERLDGSGYPNGLSGKNIIVEARILGVSDVVEAMVSHRPYRPALGIDKALREISQNKGILYDTNVVEACLKLFAQKRFKFHTNDASGKPTK